MNIVLHGAVARLGFDALLQHFGDGVALNVTDLGDSDATHAQFASADVLITIGFDKSLPPTPHLKLIHLPSSGLDEIDFSVVPDGCRVCNAFEHAIGISEYVLAAMLHWIIDLPGRNQRFKAGDWADTPRLGAPFRRELAAQTIGCIGYGTIGQAIVTRASAFGARILAVTRNPRPLQPPPAWLGSFAELDTLLQQSDFVVIACPLDDTTRGLIGAEQFSRMLPHAVLINVARGPIVDQDALFKTLRDHRIGGAVLDTWYRYPTPDTPTIQPAAHPFHELDNVLMTPHCSGWTDGLIPRRFATIIDNIERLRAGQPLINQVHPA